MLTACLSGKSDQFVVFLFGLTRTGVITMNNEWTPDTTFQVKEGYVHRKVAGADVLISIGGNVANFNGYIELNSSAACLWDQMKQPRTCQQLEQALVDTFGISGEEAQADVLDFLNDLKEHGMVNAL